MAGTGRVHLREDSDILLTVDELVVEYRAGRKQRVHAVSGVSFDIAEGETLGLVGESGCGKSSVGRAIMQLPSPVSGSVSFAGAELTALKSQELRRTRTKMQMIFQDPVSSLNPRRKIKDLVVEGPSIWQTTDKKTRDEQAEQMLDLVGLDPDAVGDRRPSQLSGGQCQRVSIGRALMLDPALLICDEPVSSLDVSIQAQILNLIEESKRRYGLSLLFIAHDLAVVKNVSDRVAVMYLGKICEVASADSLYQRAVHPYTQLLVNSVPEPDPHKSQSTEEAAGDLPSPLAPPSGCRYRTRCPLATELCAEQEPELHETQPGHYVACHYPQAAVDQRALWRNHDSKSRTLPGLGA